MSLSPSSPGNETLLILADSESSADLYYATGFHVRAKVIYVEHGDRRRLLVNDLEYGRARSESNVDEVVPTSPFEAKLREDGKRPSLTSVLDLYLHEIGAGRELTVPASFTLAHAEQLRELGYKLRLRHDPFFPDRLRKRPEEIRAIEEVQSHTEAAMAHAASLLEASEIRDDGTLHLDGSVLTSERLRRRIQAFLLERDCQAADTIVAGGDQGADPHQVGRGPLLAHETIIVDILPRSSRTRYWGDMTRTFVRGRATPEARRLFRDVVESQEVAFSLLREGVDAHEVHEAVAAFLRERGNPNGEVAGRKAGFIHATGHGIGLDIHELPRIGRARTRLQADNVVTIEPGLYYPGKGSVRIEDAVVITKDGYRNLNTFPKTLEL